MKNPVKVVMLPTESTSNVAVIKGIMKLEYKPDFRKNQLLFQHIYVTVSQDVEFIKEGDWVVVPHLGGLLATTVKEISRTGMLIHGQVANILEAGCKLEHARKIIATNDPKLNINNFSDVDRLEDFEIIVPQVKQSFLKEFVANPDGKFEVEFRCQELQHYKHHLVGNTCTCKKTTLVLNQDNTVNITVVEEEKMYSTDEVKKLLFDALTANGDFDDGWSDDEALAYIGENL
tara:strand:- start:672 stop:1367 length:696 start_codon:yes stop_codon:yes gene_type:complete